MPVKVRPARSIARAESLPLPRRVGLPQVHLRARLLKFVPTRRSLAVGVGMLVLAVGAYFLARETSLFAVSRIEVSGGSPRVAAQVRGALSSISGTSLVSLDGTAVLRRVDALPTVVRAGYDRAFPHTLRISVVPERPAAVLRRGPDSWLVSVRGRVMERLPASGVPHLPRIWVGARTPVRTGETLDPREAGAAARAVGLAGGFTERVASASYTGGSLALHLRSGLELLLGDGEDITLKIAVAERALRVLPAGTRFLDVSVPGRPVSGTGSPGVSSAQNTQQASTRG